MSDESKSEEKTEQPSAKRLKDAREKGQVARSKDFNAMVILLFTGIGLFIFGEQATREMLIMMQDAFRFDAKSLITVHLSIEKILPLTQHGLWAILPIMILIFIVSLAAPMLLGGWIFSTKAFTPQMSRLNPLKGLKRMVSAKGFMEMLKSFLKFLLIASVLFFVLRWEIPALMNLANQSIELAINGGVVILLKAFIILSTSLIFIVIIDVPFQLYQHTQQLKMTKQEVKDEYKEMEGRPEVKGQVRRRQQEIARRRMMSEIPKAQVILTNPTHYAVAIRYDLEGTKPPIVVAKGKDLIAFQINKVAIAHNIPLISLPPLARAVYFSTEINQEIPRGLYLAVAQVLAYIFQLEDKHQYERSPTVLKKVSIPAEFVKDAKETVA